MNFGWRGRKSPPIFPARGQAWRSLSGAILLIPALVILLNAAVQAMVAEGVAEYWAALIVGGIALLAGFIFVLIGVRRIKPKALLPSRTMEQMRRDAVVAAQQTRSPHDNAT